jgi:hypothetical protein
MHETQFSTCGYLTSVLRLLQSTIDWRARLKGVCVPSQECSQRRALRFSRKRE